MNPKIITGLDIGTGSIKVLSVVEKPDRSLKILSKVQVPNSGMRRGVIVDPAKVSKNICIALEKVQSETGKKVEEICVNIGGAHIFSILSKGSIVVSRADQRISEEDIRRVIQAAKTFSLPLNKKLIDFYPKQYIIDGHSGIKEPLDMKGTRMEVEILAIGAFIPYFNKLEETVLDAGIRTVDVLSNPIVSANACLTSEQKELGTVVLDIGAGTTSLAIYEEGDLIHLAIIPIGSDHITRDITVGLRIETAVAEKVKKEFGHCLKDLSVKNGRNKKINLPSIPLTFSSKLLTKIIESRVSEIFKQAQKEIKGFSSGFLPAGVVITGGGSQLPNIVDFCKNELKLPCRMGFPILNNGNNSEIEESLKKDPSFCTAWGLVLAGREGGEPLINRKKTLKGIRNIFNIFRVFIP